MKGGMKGISVRRVLNKFGRFLDWFKTLVGADVVLQGSFRTSNIGDMAIGMVLANFLNSLNVSHHMVGLIRGELDFTRYRAQIISGGGVIRDYPGEYLKARLKPINDVEMSMAIGVGVPGIRTEEGRAYVKRMEEMSSITVRDERSKNILNKYLDREVRVTACPGFLLKPSVESVMDQYLEGDQERIGLNLIPYSLPGTGGEGDLKSKNYNKITQGIREYIHSSNAHFYFIPHTVHDQLSPQEILPDCEITCLPLQDPPSTLHTVSMMDKMITTRYHSLIFSIISDRPVYPMAYAPKITSLATRLGLSELYNLSSEKNQEKIDFNNPKDYQKKKQRIISRAKENLDIIQRDLSEIGII
jgi:polysaccharide pyruvyl transferase WcaK-like protein